MVFKKIEGIYLRNGLEKLEAQAVELTDNMLCPDDGEDHVRKAVGFIESFLASYPEALEFYRELRRGIPDNDLLMEHGKSLEDESKEFQEAMDEAVKDMLRWHWK